MNKCSKKSVLVVNIAEASSKLKDVFLDTNHNLIAKIKTHPALDVEFIDTISSLQSKCIEYNPRTTVLLFVNDFVTTNDIVQNVTQNFVKGGALAIFTCLFAGAVQENKLFTSLGLPWKVGAPATENFVISPVGRFLLNDYEERFSAKSQMLTNVLPQQMLYTMANDTAKQNVFQSEGNETSSLSSTMAAFAKLGKGAVSYIGNHCLYIEEVYVRIIVSLCTVN